MTGFICHDDYLNKTAILTDEQLGRLIRACMKYHATGEIDQLDGVEGMAFEFIRFDIDKAEETYKAKCEKNRQNRLSKLTNDNGRQQQSTNDNERERSQVRQDKTKQDKAKQDKTNAIFDQFWAAYPRHINKQGAMRAFEKAKVDSQLLQIILSAIEKQKKSEQWMKDGGQFIPHPATWLNQRRWEDETVISMQKPAVKAQDYEQRDYSDVQRNLEDAQRKRFEERLRAAQ